MRRRRNIAEGGAPIADGAKYVNSSLMAEGLVGDHLPISVFYFPVVPGSPYLPPAARGRRHWTMVASPEPDMRGSREQTVWFRFVQLECASAAAAACRMVGQPQYWDTYWWSRTPGANGTDGSGAVNQTTGGGFYGSLLANRRWWARELQAEGMMALELPSPASTNGTMLWTQARHNLLRGMLTWHDTWGPRYGVLPGYGIAMQNGFQDTFTATATAAVEWGALPYARGVIDNWLRYYVRDNGMVNAR